MVLTLILGTHIGALCAPRPIQPRKHEDGDVGVVLDDTVLIAANDRELKILVGLTLLFTAIGATAAVVGATVAVVDFIDGDQSGSVGTIESVCNNCCNNCEINIEFQRLKQETPVSVNGCRDESCFCSASGVLGVQPNPFDDTCGTFFNCPFPQPRDCAPGTLFNPAIGVCDFPANVKCVAVRV